MAPSASSTAYIFHHVILPPQLPQKDDCEESHERALIQIVLHALHDLQENVEGKHRATVQSAIKTLENLRCCRDGLEHISENPLKSLLSKVASGELEGILPLQIKEQNAGVLVSRYEDQVVFEFLELSPTNESAMQAGRLLRSFPGCASQISAHKMKDLDLCKSIAATVAKMTTQTAPGVRPLVRKNGTMATEARDTTHPGLVTDFLMSFITAHGQTKDVQRITKHTREDVLWSNCLLPWRRSPLWLLLRVTLQLFFSRKNPAVKDGLDLYKSFMVFLLTRVLNLVKNQWKELGSEAVHMTSAKLNRRLRKFELSKYTSGLGSTWSATIKNDMIGAHSLIQKHWLDLTVNPGANIDTTTVQGLRPEKNIDMNLPCLDDFLSETAARQDDTSCSQFRPTSTYPHFKSAEIPNVSFGTDEYKVFRLAAFENWVENQLQSSNPQYLHDTETCGKLRQLMESYHVNGSHTYAGVPVSMSIMYLTLVELWVVCDKSACLIHPLLHEYDPEIDLVELQCLILPLKSHLERLHHVEKYVSSRRNEAKGSLPSLYRKFGDASSFAVRHFDRDAELQATLSQIEKTAALKQQQKVQELNDLKQKYENLMHTYNTSVCQNEVYVTNHHFGYTETRHSRNCSRCACKTMAEGLGIHIYEWPVSAISAVAKSTVFELQIPKAFGEWRDSSVYLIVSVLGFRAKNASRPSYSFTLDMHQEISSRLSKQYQSRRIVPLSTIKPHTATHRKQKNAVHLLSKADVCLANALRLEYYDKSLGILNNSVPNSTEEIPQKCKYELPERSKALGRFAYKPPSSKDGVQANEVLATLSDCPLHFSIEEYKALVSLPLGSQLVYLNTITQLAIPAVDFTKPETQCLVLQAIQQAGESNGNIERVTHSILNEESFCLAILRQLDIALLRVTENWESWRAAATFSLLAKRVLSLAPSSNVRTQAFGYLDQLREICTKWIHRLKERAANSTEDDQRTELCSRATEIALVCIGSYDVDDRDIDTILHQKSAISTLISCSITVQENYGTVQSEHPRLYKSSLNAWKALMYRMLPTLHEHICLDSTGLDEAIVMNWAAFQPATTSHWASLGSTQKHWICITSGTLPVQFNLLTAELLVNGLPLARLPGEFLCHNTYKTLFAKSSLEVVPTNEPGLKFSAKTLYHDYKLHFGMKGSDMLVVAIKGAADRRWDLVPSRVFQGRLPHKFIHDYVHWYDHSNETVEFRPRITPWSTQTEMWRLRRDASSRTWRLTKATCILIDTTSRSAQGYSNIFRALEDAEHIHVLLDDTTQVVDIELPRLQLGFFVEHGESKVHSRQYRGMSIDSDQNIGTLVGLVSKLVLKNQSDRMLVIPVPSTFGKTSIQYEKMPGMQNMRVSINRSAAVKACVYTVDKDLGRVVDSGDLESKLLLSFLHALTSHCLPDRLTNLTGVESSLSILQSAATKSFDFLTENQVTLLSRIGGLSTRRSFYPEHLKVMQQVVWNGTLPTLSQHPSLCTAVESIFDQALETSFFHPESSIYGFIRDTQKSIASSSLLRLREKIRTSTFRVSGFGAEEYTTSHDSIYQTRDRIQATARTSRVHQTISMFQQDPVALLKSIPDLKRSLLKTHFSGTTVAGTNEAYNPTNLRYDAKWLEKSSPILLQYWCSLHRHLPNASSACNRYDVAIWLATMSYADSADMEAIQALFAFYSLPDFATIQPPSAAGFDLTWGYTWIENDIANIASRAARSFDSSAEARLPKLATESEKQHDRRIRSIFRNHQDTAVKDFTAALRDQWPIRKPSRPISTTISTYINVESAMSRATAKFGHWYANREFHQYLQRLSEIMARQRFKEFPRPHYAISPPQFTPGLSAKIRCFNSDDIFIKPTCQGVQPSLVPPDEPELLIKECMPSEQKSSMKESLEELCQGLRNYAASECEKNYVDDLRKSCAAYYRHHNRNEERSSLTTEYRGLVKKYHEDCKSYLNQLSSELLRRATDHDVLSLTKHSLRISPLFWLAQLHRDRFDTLSDSWKTIIITYGLAITNFQRAQRLLAAVDKPVDLIEELRHVGHSNWDPRLYPETLLLEAESGILVRKEQEFIASQMRSDGVFNIVLQLLMGGGKSTTIVPILAAYFSDKEKLARVIVAKPQSKQMLQMLISKLGGLLNRRIYHMPFSRNLKMTLADAAAIRQLYTECVANQGVLMVLPEQILSFRLMALECVLTDQPEIARSLLSTQTFFDEKSRDIVDESDANFDVKFELIYTMGAQQSIEFAPQRWLIIEEIIGLVPRYALKVQKVLPEAVDIHNSGIGKFPRIRLLRKDAVDQLLEQLAKHIVECGIPGLPIRSQSQKMQAAIHKYITQTELEESEIEAVETSRFWTESTKHPLLLVRGLIAGGVLRFVLTNKRWRVNYGLDTTRTPATNLAVPYRSKDSPSPRSEFSHPDVVILLTLLSYYYGGLSDDELFDTFTHLLKSDQATIHYDEFVSTASSSLRPAFRQLSGLSIRDRHQCIKDVFPALRYSKKAIDYFLSYIIFPKQLKQFPSKLSSSGWDLGAKKTHPLSGFSGTNDTLHLLPLEVKHLDLPSQSHTNAQVLAYLLQQETSVELLPPRTDLNTSDGDHLLRFVGGLTVDIRVVLDCGASILEQSNRQVAQRWLDIRDCKIQAVVYFEDEELSVLDRTGRIDSFQTSPFAKNLEVCIVYLDEAHTRGTDLKLPRDYRAAVTLGSQLTKDRLTQACMRLRKLGHGQSVTFIVPTEISTKIRELTRTSASDTIRVKDVLCWSIGETWQDLKRSMPLWAVQGNRFECQRGRLHGVNTTEDQAQSFLEAEAQGLETRYKPKPKNNDTAAHTLDWDLSNENIAHIVSRCRDFEAMGFSSAALSEEQERELSPEIEEERQVERPARLAAEKHALHPDLYRLIDSGQLIIGSEAYEPAFQALRSTSAASLFPLSGFPVDLLATKDFIRTVKIPPGSTHADFISDSYQRQVQFVISVPSRSSSLETVQSLLIISPYEANALLPKIRLKKTVTLHLFAPRSNTSFQSLDRLELYNVGRCFAPGSLSRSLTLQLNLFAGSLYLRSVAEYNELCDHLGLLRTEIKDDQQVWADGFIDPPTGIWGLQSSPVPFLRVLLLKIRREGEGVEKTHLGKVLNGTKLEEADFEGGS